MLRGSSVLALIVLVGVLCAPTPSRADPATEEAKIHNQAAKKLFNLGLFREAAEEYQKAYRAKPMPAFLFNLAQCFKRMASIENLRRSVFYFRSFLHNEPETPARQAIEEEIARIEHELQAAERARRPKPVYKRWWFWTLVGAAVTGAAVATGVAFRPEHKPIDGSIGTYGVP